MAKARKINPQDERDLHKDPVILVKGDIIRVCVPGLVVDVNRSNGSVRQYRSTPLATARA